MMRWYSVKEKLPERESDYMIMTRYGEVHSVHYTPEGGWNTSTDYKGNLSSDNAINDGYFVAWLDHDIPSLSEVTA